MALLDPTTRDLRFNGRRDMSPVDNETKQLVYHRLYTRAGSCFWDRAFGSTLHELDQAKIGRTFQQDLEDRIRVALKPLTTAKVVSLLSFQHERPSRERWHCRVELRDARQAPIPFDVFVAVA